VRAEPPRPSRLDTVSAEALFLLSAVAQYAGAVIAVNLFDEVPAASVAWLRVIGAALTIGAFSWRHRARRWSRAELLAAAIFGTATALMNLFFYLGIARLDLGPSVAIEFIGPITVAAVRTRTRRNAAALGLAVVGVVVLSGLELAGEPLGLTFIFLASTMWALYIVVGSRVARLDRGLSGLALGLCIGAIAVTPIGLPGSGAVWGSPSLLFACLGVGVLSNAIGYGIDQHVMRRMTVRRFAVLLALLPVTALAMGAIALDQRPTPAELLGVAFILAGVITQDRT
jgi:inner membrane transporter RhtA